MNAVCQAQGSFAFIHLRLEENVGVYDMDFYGAVTSRETSIRKRAPGVQRSGESTLSAFRTVHIPPFLRAHARRKIISLAIDCQPEVTQQAWRHIRPLPVTLTISARHSQPGTLKSH